MNYNFWEYCECGWQTAKPNLHAKQCGCCGGSLKTVGGSQKEMNYLRDLVNYGEKICVIVNPGVST